jgi:glycerol-3-phosphate acyltransferase PlsY
VILAGLYISAYFLGAIPFAVLLGRIKGIDILKAGSGNPGMTNVWRNLGPGFGIACFALDILKGLLPTVAARCLIHDRIGPFDPQFLWFTVGCAALVGHSCSIFLGFKGGKAVSASLGTILGASPIVGLSCFATFVLLLSITRYVAVSSVIAVASVMVYNRIYPGQSVQLLPVFAALTAFVAWRHRTNFVRLAKGTEPKVKWPKIKGPR